jgi:hypothetical protein
MKAFSPVLVQRSIAQAMRLEGWPQRQCKRPSFETRTFAPGRRLAPQDKVSAGLDMITFTELLN